MRFLRLFTAIACVLALFALKNVGALFGKVENIGDLHNTSIKISQEEKEQLKTLVSRAISHLNNASDEPFVWKLDRVTNIRRQLVAGLNYSFDVIVVRSDCLKQKDRLDFHKCSVPQNSPRELCTLDVFVDLDDAKERHFIRDCNFHQSIGKAERVKFGGDRKMAKIMEKTRRAIVSKPADEPIWQFFSAFVDRYGKIYETKQEALHRFLTYKRNQRRVKLLQENEQGTAIYGETKFMDMTTDEFKGIYLPYKWEQPHYKVNQFDDFLPLYHIDEKIPTSFDWRQKGVVTDVKNQAQCGSCWAFSVTGNIEGQWAIKTSKLVPLSEQELLDCDIVDSACSGGLPLNAYKEIIRIGGLEQETEYPYDARKESCQIKRSKFSVYINDSVQLPKDESKMAIWLFKNGPISIGVNAYPLQFYRHGISHPWKIFCSPMMLNHGVLIVGYGIESNKPFWIVKNSWGANWGENGYYRIYRGRNVCGVNEMATSSIIY